MQKSIFIILICLIGLGVIFFACADKYPAPANHFAQSESSCTSCHLNADLLKQVATPLPDTGGDTGES